LGSNHDLMRKDLLIGCEQFLLTSVAQQSSFVGYVENFMFWKMGTNPNSMQVY